MVWLLGWLAACGVDEGTLPGISGPPAFSSTDWERASVATIIIAGAAPGAAVTVYGSVAGQGQGPCFGACLGILSPVTLGSGTTDGNGGLALSVTIPPQVPLGTAWTQAVVGNAATGVRVVSVTEPAVWRPGPGTSWQWQLLGQLDTSYNVDMYDVDLFDTSAAAITSLHNQGRVVVCYFSAGSWEDWRADAALFPPAVRGNNLAGWPGERWLDVRSAAVRDQMAARMAEAAAKGCDAVEPDNVDGYQNNNGFGLTAQDQLSYNRFLAATAHALGLSVGLKNDLGQIRQLVGWFDWALNEECFAYQECARLAPFVQAGKAVFHVEYPARWAQAQALANQVCAANLPLETLIKPLDLTAPQLTCP